jgi:multidrug efflux pump subunit AcrB
MLIAVIGASASSACRCANIPTSIRRRLGPDLLYRRRRERRREPDHPGARGALAGLEGLQTITSRSRDGQSDITVEFAPGRDIDSAANDVRDRVGAAAADLPEEALAPQVRKVDADAAPILFLVVSKPGWSRLQLSDYVDRNLVDRFSAIDGVAQVFIFGEARPAMRVWLQPERLAAFSLTPADVETALRRQNVELPAGRLESQSQNVTLRVNRAFSPPRSSRPRRRPRRGRLSGPARRRRPGRAGAGKPL